MERQIKSELGSSFDIDMIEYENQLESEEIEFESYYLNEFYSNDFISSYEDYHEDF